MRSLAERSSLSSSRLALWSNSTRQTKFALYFLKTDARASLFQSFQRQKIVGSILQIIFNCFPDEVGFASSGFFRKLVELFLKLAFQPDRQHKTLSHRL